MHQGEPVPAGKALVCAYRGATARARSPAAASRSAHGASPARGSPEPDQPRTMSSSPWRARSRFP